MMDSLEQTLPANENVDPLFSLRERIDKLTAENNKLKSENERQRTEIKLLKAITKRADGEVFLC